MRLSIALACAFLLAACATNPMQRDSEKLALYRANAGAPVESFDYYGSISSWTLLGDTTIAIWPRPSRAYIVEVHGPCSDLSFSQAISLSSRMGRVYARFDDVIPVGRGSTPFPCRIREIRPLDVDAIRQSERTARDQSVTSGT